MHRALEIEDILEIVFQELDKSSQASALRTCRSWSSLAAQYLWRTGAEEGFRYLIESCEDTVSKSVAFEDLLACTKWKHFQYYSTFIRSLDLCRYIVSGTRSAKFFNKMVEYSHEIMTTPLLPRLVLLEVMPSLSFSPSWVQLLLCPSLVSLDIKVFGFDGLAPDTDSLAALLENIWKCAPALSDVGVMVWSVDNYPRQFDEALRVTYMMLEHLRSLECTPSFAFGHVGLKTLAQLPRLLELTVSGNRAEELYETFDDGLPESGEVCSSLIRVQLQAAHLATSTQFLERLPSTLQEIALNSIETDGEVIASFAKACARFKTLKAFELVQYGYLYDEGHMVEGDVNQQLLDLEWFVPLTACGELKEVCISWAKPGNFCKVNDDPLVRFAESWVDIEVFELQAFNNHRRPSHSAEVLSSTGVITQKSLLALATHCHRLRRLCLPSLNFHTSIRWHTLPEPSMGLTHLRVHKILSDIALTSTLVSVIWPSWLSEGGGLGGEDEEDDDENADDDAGQDIDEEYELYEEEEDSDYFDEDEFLTDSEEEMEESLEDLD